jgi:SP family general alpha glucoside:H+ symporter-like MFS transporter
MEGYDTTLIGSFFAYPAFQKKYGFYTGAKNGYQLTSAWKTGLQDGGAIGNNIGALLNGYFAPKYGHRKVMLVSLVAMTAFIFVSLSLSKRFMFFSLILLMLSSTRLFHLRPHYIYYVV